MDHITVILTLFKILKNCHIVHLNNITIRKCFQMKTTRPRHVDTFKINTFLRHASPQVVQSEYTIDSGCNNIG